MFIYNRWDLNKHIQEREHNQNINKVLFIFSTFFIDFSAFIHLFETTLVYSFMIFDR
jgi:hypothetical protein